MPVGSAQVVERVLSRPDVAVVSNPEFLREGQAVHDCLHPDRVVISCDDQAAAAQVARLYEGLNAPIMVTVPSRAAPSFSKAWPLFAGMGTLMLGIGLQSTLLAYRGTLEGFATLVTGAIMSCYYLGFLFGTTLSRKLVRQVGHIRVFAALAAVASVTALVQGLFVNPWAWGSMRLLSGLNATVNTRRS